MVVALGPRQCLAPGDTGNTSNAWSRWCHASDTGYTSDTAIAACCSAATFLWRRASGDEPSWHDAGHPGADEPLRSDADGTTAAAVAGPREPALGDHRRRPADARQSLWLLRCSENLLWR